MVDINTLVLDDDVIAYSDRESPYGIIGVLESAKIALLSVPKANKKQAKTELSFVPLDDIGDTFYAEITDFDLNSCRLVADEKIGWNYRIRSISVTLKGWNNFVDFFREQGLISNNEATILSI